MPNDQQDESPTTDALVAELFSDEVDGLSLHSLLGDKDVKAALISELRDAGVPAPGLAYRLLVFALGGCERFLGGSIKSRLQAIIDRTPAVAGVFQKILNLRHGAKAKDELKASLLASFKGGEPLPADIVADDASSLDMVIALHTASSLQNLDTAIATLGDDLIEDIRGVLADQFNQLVAPNLSWMDEVTVPERLSAFDRLKYTSGIDPFVGREIEIDLLHRFAGDPSFGGRIYNFQWMLLTGQGGEGKTRLAYEFTRGRLDKSWYQGKLDLGSLNAFGNPIQWRPTQPTFIVIDYAQTAPEEIHSLLSAFSSQAASYEFPVRLLLLERNADASWTDKMLPETGVKPVILQHHFGRTSFQGSEVGPLLPDAIVALMTQRINLAKLDVPTDQQLLSLASSIDPRFTNGAIKKPIPRPLFALAAAEAIIDAISNGAPLPDRLDQEEVLSGIIKRDRDTVWCKVVTNDGVRRRYEMGLAIATFAQGIALQDLNPDAFGSGRVWLPPLPPDHNETALAAFGFRDGQWPQMEPDILGEFFLSEQLLNSSLSEHHRNALISGAMSLHQTGPLIVLIRMSRDFPKRFEALGLASTVSGVTGTNGLLSFARLVIALTSNDGTPNIAFKIFDAILDREEWKSTSSLGIEIAKAAVNISSQAGNAGDWVRVDKMLARLDALRKSFPLDQEIALTEAEAAFNISITAGKAGDWDRVDKMLARLDALRKSFQLDQEIAVNEAQAAFNISHAAGEAGDRVRVDKMLARLDALRQCFPLDQEIALEEAKAAVNISNAAGEAGDWVRVDKMLARFDALRQSFPQDQEIALTEARAAVNITNHAGKAGDWDRVDEMLAKIDTLRKSFPLDQEIALTEAKAAFNISNAAGKAGDWDRVDKMLARLNALIADIGNISFDGPDGSSLSLKMLRDHVASSLETIHEGPP